MTDKDAFYEVIKYLPLEFVACERDGLYWISMDGFLAGVDWIEPVRLCSIDPVEYLEVAQAGGWRDAEGSDSCGCSHVSGLFAGS